MSDQQLKQHRDAIDAIDVQILELINRRAEHARHIGEIKGGGVMYRPEREAQVLRRIKQLNQGPLPDESAARLFREIMSACLSLERPLNVAFLGPLGTFTESAAIKQFGHAALLAPCRSIDEVFRATEAGQTDFAVVPVENSTEGAVGRTLDLLMQTSLKVCGEVVLRIHQHLLRKSATLDGIQRVY
jgi:chorismate mutase/prephenate dehydratase